MKSVDPGILPQSVCFSFTPSDLAKEMLFYPTWCGHYYCNANYYMRRQSYPPLLVAFIRSGQFRIEFRGKTYTACKGDVLLLDCSEPHYYHAEDGLEFLYIHFDGSNAHTLCQHVLTLHGPLLQGENNVMIGRMIYDMVDFYEHNGVESMFESAMRVYRIINLLLAPPTQHRQYNNPIDRTIRHIRSNVGKPITLTELASIANLSTYYFSHCFKQQTGFSPMEYVINTRIDQAKILLKRTTLSVAEIAYEVGYASSGGLINLFVKKVGMSPKEYRNSQ